METSQGTALSVYSNENKLYYIKMDLGETDYESRGWTEPAQDRILWQTSVNYWRY